MKSFLVNLICSKIIKHESKFDDFEDVDEEKDDDEKEDIYTKIEVKNE